MYCTDCIDFAEDDETTSDMASVLCAKCLSGRAEHVACLRRDAVYRSHLSRQIAGIPCDTTSGCPHHDTSDSLFTMDTADPDYYQQRDAVSKAWVAVSKNAYNTIKAAELLAGYSLLGVQYCGTCYHEARNILVALKQDDLLDAPEFTPSTPYDVELCAGCLDKRDTYIAQFHGHQGASRSRGRGKGHTSTLWRLTKEI